MSQNKDFYNSTAWKNTRRNYLQSVGGLCERCLERGIIRPADIVHHKIPITKDTYSDLNLSLSWNNLQALCRECHAEVHEDIYAARRKKRYKIDKFGRVIMTDSPLPIQK